MADQETSGAVSGAVSGFMAGGPIGALAGAALGALGGAFGDKAAKYRRAANKEDKRIAAMQRSVQRRDLVRSAYIARAEAVAAAGGQESGALDSSGFRGVNTSISTQLNFGLKYQYAHFARNVMKEAYLKKAGKYQAKADMINGLIDIGASFAGGIGNGSKDSTKKE